MSNRDGDELCDTECLDLLQSERRRTLLEHLADEEDRTHSLRSLARAVAETERDGDPAIPSERVRISLHHAHLPKLESAGVLDYDTREKTVEYLGSPPVERWLDRIDE